MRIVGVVAMVAACTPPGHLRLEPATDALTFEERVVLYNRLMGTRMIGFSCVRHDCVPSNELALVNGRTITQPEDVLPAVPVDSAAAVHARRARNARRTQLVAGLGGLALAVAGGAIWYFSRPDDIQGRAGSEEGRIAGIGLVVVGGVGGGFTAWFAHARAETETARTFEHYPAALEQQLGICWAGDRALPCEDADPWKPRDVIYRRLWVPPPPSGP